MAPIGSIGGPACRDWYPGSTCGARSDQPDDLRGVAPQPLEAVELALLGGEEVDDHGSVVEQDPTSGAAALHANRTDSVIPQLVDDPVGQRLELTVAAAGADHEVIGHGRHLGRPQQHDVDRLPVGGEVHDPMGEVAGIDGRQPVCALLDGHFLRYRPRAVINSSTARGTRYRMGRPAATRALISELLTSSDGPSSRWMRAALHRSARATPRGSAAAFRDAAQPPTPPVRAADRDRARYRSRRTNPPP